MKVFVTGGTGFVGSHLVEKLMKAGHEPICLVRNPKKISKLFPNQKPETVVGDLDDTGAIERGCHSANAVVHVAGLTAARNRAEFHRVNVQGTQTVARIAAARGGAVKRFVYVSSLAASGPSQPGTRIESAHRPNPVSQYGWSKLAGEEAVRRTDLPWTIMRPPTVYGPRDTEVLKLFKFAKRGIVPVLGDGTQENSFVYVTDLIDAILASLDEKSVGETYFPCHTEVCSQRDLVTLIGAALEKDRPPRVVRIPAPVARGALWVTGTIAGIFRKATLLNADRANDFLAESWTCSPASLQTRLGWSATTDLRTGLKTTAQWYTKVGWL